jgi:hypothetical protein|uniref:Uncharacterized protein n=1 Tax=Candidatus Aramenus sulfurataquae TaxID=1326980 RepID=A0A0F2LNB9_9CREN|nr:hypothetical protein [Candidatus Aramenus sulfurataquae]
MSLPQESSQTENIEEKLVNILLEKILKQEDSLIAKKLKAEIEYLIERNNDDDNDEIMSAQEMIESLDNKAWYISKLFAVLKNGYRAKFSSYYSDYGYTPDEMLLKIAGLSDYEGYIEVVAPSGATIGYIEIELRDVFKKPVYEDAKKIYEKWHNLLSIMFELSKKLAEEIAKDP